MEFKSFYTSRNHSYKKNLVFHLGGDAGFYSEFNNMILCVVYCLNNNIRFSLQSSVDNIFYKNGWTDYFKSFFSEVNLPGLKKYNVRPYMTNGRSFKYVVPFLKRLYGIDYFTQDVFDLYRTGAFENEYFNFEDLEIKGSLLNVCSILIKEIYQFNEDTLKQVNQIKDTVKIPKDYIGIHIRKGDKINEFELLNTDYYIKYLRDNFEIKNIFVYTDDHKVLRECMDLNTDINVFSIIPETDAGYEHANFKKQPAQFRKNKIIEMFANVELLSSARAFIGTFNSNPGMFIGMRKQTIDCYDINGRKWQIW